MSSEQDEAAFLSDRVTGARKRHWAVTENVTRESESEIEIHVSKVSICVHRLVGASREVYQIRTFIHCVLKIDIDFD